MHEVMRDALRFSQWSREFVLGLLIALTQLACTLLVRPPAHSTRHQLGCNHVHVCMSI